jgi:PAS domain-containing protein
VRNLEATLFDRSGNPRLISSNIDLVSFGGEEYILSTLRDITKHKKAEADLRRSEANLAEGQRMSHTGSWAWNPSAETMFCSQELLRIFGLAASAKPSHEDFLRLIHPEDQPRVRETFEQAVRTYDAEYRIVRSDGSIRHIWPVPVGSPRFSLGQAVILDQLIEAPEGREQVRQS